MVCDLLLENWNMSNSADRKIRVLFFAKAREIAGDSAIDFKLDASIRSISCKDLLHRICVQYHLLAIENCVILSVNREFNDDPDFIVDLDGVYELAVIPPISGGWVIQIGHLKPPKMSNFLNLQTDVLDLAAINELIVHESCGGVSFFVGTTRDNFESKKVSVSLLFV